jgi:hypothetical protein
VTANTLVRVRHRILAAHGETGRLGELDSKSSHVGWHARICGRALGGCVVRTNPGAFQTDDDVPTSTRYVIQIISSTQDIGKVGAYSISTLGFRGA